MAEDLSGRVDTLRDSDDVQALADLGCDLSDAGRHSEAEWCFRRCVELGDELMGLNLGNALYDQGRYDEAAIAFRRAANAGDHDAWINLGNSLTATARFQESVAAFESAVANDDTSACLNLGQVLEELGDLAGAIRAYQAGSAAGDANATVAWAFMLREQDDQPQAELIMQRAAEQGSDYGKAVMACWLWDRTSDPALEADLRAGAEHYPDARAGLGHLLRQTDRLAEAIDVLQTGLDADEASSAIPLGNIYADDLFDTASAAAAYRRGIELGDAYSHHNLAGLLEDEGNLDEALNHYRMAAADGDELAARALLRLSQDE